MGMIDKLDVRIPRHTKFTPEFQSAYTLASERRLLRPSKLYLSSADFRPYGYRVRLHMFSRYGTQNHKLELYDTGDLTLQEMLAEVRRVFICDPLRLDVTRLDLCVDIEGIGVDWFKRHARVMLKRHRREIGYMTITSSRGETLYFGVKPNQFRIYDKTAERRYQFAHLHRKAMKEFDAIAGGAPSQQGVPQFPTFQEMFGHSEDAVISRLERQYGGRNRVCCIQTLQRLADINPFAELTFLSASERDINPLALESTSFWAAHHLRTLNRENGLQYVRSHMSLIVGSKNLKKVWNKYSGYLIPPNDCPGIDEQRLLELYRESMFRQLVPRERAR